MNLGKCPECDDIVVKADNDVFLNYPSVAYDEIDAGWTLMNLGSSTVASVGNPGLDGKGHSLHEHQPKGSVMAQ